MNRYFHRSVTFSIKSLAIVVLNRKIQIHDNFYFFTVNNFLEKNILQSSIHMH